MTKPVVASYPRPPTVIDTYLMETAGSEVCTECPDEQLSYSGHATCLACITNTSCPLGPNGETCSGTGDCYLGVCNCE